MLYSQCHGCWCPSEAKTWWHHQMETLSMLLALCAGNSRSQRPVTRDFDVFSDLRLNKLLSKQWSGWWFETPSRPLWHYCNKLGHQRPWCRPNSRGISAWASEMWNIISLSIAYWGNPVYFKMPPLDSRVFLEDFFVLFFSLRKIHYINKKLSIPFHHYGETIYVLVTEEKTRRYQDRWLISIFSPHLSWSAAASSPTASLITNSMSSLAVSSGR